MKYLILLIFHFTCLNVYSQVFVSGYLKKDGSYTPPHYRSSPNETMFDNYSTKGNINPYTGKPGWITPVEKVKGFYSNYFDNKSIPLKEYLSTKELDNIFKYLDKNDSSNYFKTEISFNEVGIRVLV